MKAKKIENKKEEGKGSVHVSVKFPTSPFLDQNTQFVNAM